MNNTSINKRVRFHLAGYLFTYRKDTGRTQVRIDMWREDESTHERFWITVAACAPNRGSARSVALALVAWVKSCDIGPRRDLKALAVSESFAMLQAYLRQSAPTAIGTVRTGRPALQVTRLDAVGGTHGAAA